MDQATLVQQELYFVFDDVPRQVPEGAGSDPRTDGLRGGMAPVGFREIGHEESAQQGTRIRVSRRVGGDDVEEVVARLDVKNVNHSLSAGGRVQESGRPAFQVVQFPTVRPGQVPLFVQGEVPCVVVEECRREEVVGGEGVDFGKLPREVHDPLGMEPALLAEFGTDRPDDVRRYG